MAQEVQIPAGVPYWTQRLVLDGQTYYLTCQLNQRVDRWFFSLSDAQQQPILEGRKMLPKRNLLQGVASPAKPPGWLMVIDWSGGKGVPTEATFSTETVGLVYLSVDELPV